MKKIAYFLLAWFLRTMVRFIGRIIFRLRIGGEKNIPETGGALLVANHASYMDFVLIVASIPRPVSFVMNADVFRKPALRWILEALNCIPINPREGKNNLESFNQAVSEQVLAGHIVVIFAEGTVTRTGQLLEFKKGVEHLSARIGEAPVIPVHFHNVQGTPFTYRGGKNQRERFSFNTIRREVLVNIGAPIVGKLTAFSLRQRMKEMEVENFQTRVRAMKTLDARMYDVIRQAKYGEWMDDTTRIAFHELPDKMAQLKVVLREALQHDQRVAVLLPKSCDAYMLNLWLLLNRKTVVNIDPEFSNEERFYVYNKAQVKTLITTRDLTFTKWAATAECVIYMEDIMEALEKGIQLNVLSQRMNHWQKGWNKMFQSSSQMEEEVVLFFRKKNREEIRCVALTHTNLLAVLTSIRQVYHFRKGSRLLANIDLSNSYGYVLELLLPLVCDLKLDIVTSQNNIEEYLENLFSFEPSLVLASPAQLNAIAETAQLKNIPFLKTIFTADIHPNEQAIASLTARGIQVMVCAGMAETSSLFALNNHNYTGLDIVGKPLEQENAATGTIGKPIPGVALKICDEQNPMRELSNDEEGVIWVKGPSVALTRKEEDGCNPVLVDGWFNTGWKGSVNHKGFVTMVESIAVMAERPASKA
jgi:acyl-[acyl-carrier-protein]-phospholipid O-acyltransferase/long-chain-fatty-acid--[acyl-carrier-protein] ligase